MALPYSPKLRLATFWPALAALIVSSLTALLMLSRPLIDQTAIELEQALLLLSPVLPDPTAAISAPDEALEETLATLVSGTDFRLTLITEQGLVLADTARAFDTVGAMENHRSRPEVVEALARGSGHAHRRSASTGETTAYAARLIRGADGTVWIARLAQPTRAFQYLASRLARVTIGATVAAALVAFLVSLWLTRSLFRPLSELIADADRLASDGPHRPVAIPDVEELATLARALDRLDQERRRRIAEVEAERDHLGATVASMTEGVLVVDTAGAPQLANPALRRLLGVPSTADTPDLLDLAREPRLVDLISSVLESGEPAAVEIERLEPTPRTLALLGSPLAGNGGVVVLARDLTESERLNQMRRDFVANVSHELKTPLAAIRGFAETLVDGAVAERDTALRFSQRILDQCHRLGELLDDLLTLSRLESSEPIRARERVALGALAEEAIELVTPRAEAKGVRLRLEAPAGIEIAGDAEGLVRLLANLLDNAVKYNREGGVVSLRLDRRGDEALLEVADSGIGIAPTHLPRIFERFYRVDKGRAREEGGTGLGLAIVKHVAQAHGGRVEVESELGSGSTFRVFLPIVA